MFDQHFLDGLPPLAGFHHPRYSISQSFFHSAFHSAYPYHFFFLEYRQYTKIAGDPCLIVDQPRSSNVIFLENQSFYFSNKGHPAQSKGGKLTHLHPAELLASIIYNAAFKV
jgi:hypothetical protein